MYGLIFSFLFPTLFGCSDKTEDTAGEDTAFVEDSDIEDTDTEDGDEVEEEPPTGPIPPPEGTDTTPEDDRGRSPQERHRFQ